MEDVLFRVLIILTSHQWIRSWIVSLIGFELAMLRFIDSQSHSLLYFAFLCIENREYCYYVRTVVIYDLTISKVFVYDPLLWFHCICQALCWFSRIIRMTPMQEMENFFPRYTWVKIPTKPTEIFVTIEFEVSIWNKGILNRISKCHFISHFTYLEKLNLFSKCTATLWLNLVAVF